MATPSPAGLKQSPSHKISNTELRQRNCQHIFMFKVGYRYSLSVGQIQIQLGQLLTQPNPIFRRSRSPCSTTATNTSRLNFCFNRKHVSCPSVPVKSFLLLVPAFVIYILDVRILVTSSKTQFHKVSLLLSISRETH